MPKYDVYFLTVCMSWEDVEAESEDEAIGQCQGSMGVFSRINFDEPTYWHAEERDEEDG